MAGLILEGGTMRTIFSAGIMDALLDMGVMFPYCIGVSAGISNGVSYISGQKGRNLEVLLRYRNDKRYLSKRNFFFRRSPFGLDFIFDEIPNQLIPFDWDTFVSYPGDIFAGVINVKTGQMEYLDCKKMDKKSTILRATCALPFVFPTIKWNGVDYYDGGMGDPIPIRKAMADGHEKNLVILTQPKGYTKDYSRDIEFIIRHVRRRFPKLVNILKTRHIAYNETLKLCEQLEEEGKAVVLRPSYTMKSLEKDSDQIRANYNHGYSLAFENIQRILQLFPEPVAQEETPTWCAGTSLADHSA